ncbi:MAG: hypothetical protein AMXMBFR64_54090 [Myxococcales bacterium]
MNERRWKSWGALSAVCALALALGGPAAAAVPQVMNAQGVLRTAGGQVVDGSYALTFSLYGQQAGGIPLWTETVGGVPVKSGLFSVLLGNGTPIPAALFAQSDSLWLAIQVEDDVELPRERLVTQAFAFEAQHAATATLADTATTAQGLSCSGCVDGVAIAAGSIDGAKIAAGAVGSAQIADGSVSPSDVSFNYAGGTTKGGAATNVECVGCIEAGEVSFGYAGSATAGGAASDVACTGCVSAAELDFAAVTQTELATAIANIYIPQVTLESLGCSNGQVAEVVGGTWACANKPQGTVPTAKCDGEYEALQWDGTSYKCKQVLATGASGGLAKGFEQKDSWGYTWDGLERQSATWAVADAACKAKGGRLPTLTELYRVSGAGLSEVGNTYETNYLWTRTQWAPAQHGRVRLTDGATGGLADDTASAYRCVWPNNTLGYFAGNHCYGPPGAECWTDSGEGKRMHVDKYERPVATYVAATDECNFYHAHVPTTLDFAENVTAGTGLPNGSNAWVWTSDASRYDHANVVRWTGSQPASFDGTYSTWQSYANKSGNTYNFRCIGVNYDAGAHPNTILNEQVAKTTYVKGEKLDMGLTAFAVAASACFEKGGHMAMQRDMMELVRDGLPNGTNSLLWTADTSSATNTQVVRWTGIDPSYTDYYSTYATWNNRNGSLAYRCVYYPLDTDYAGPTGGKCVSDSDCFTVQKGGTTKIKMWADNFDRSPLTYIGAVRACNDEGGHLASARDLTELARSGLANGSNNWLWTADAVDGSGVPTIRVLIMRWLNVDTAFNALSATYATDSNKTGTRPYRCVWTNELR